MKKLVLLLILFLSISINAQINQNVTPYQLCSNFNIPGIGSFDLTTKISEILNGQNPVNYTITFYETFTDSQNGGNPITNPTNFVNISNPLTIYIRTYNNQTSEVEFTSFQLMVLNNPVANPAVLSFCDLMELPIYNLNDADTQITAAATSSIVTYYETLANAQNSSNSIANGYVPLINPGTQVLYARVQNAATGCFAITTLSLNTHNCQACQTPTSVTTSNVTINSANINWVENGTATSWDILALPSGAPLPTAGSTGFVSAFTNPFTLTGLTPGTNYTLYVRAICSVSSMSDWSTSTSLMTNVAPPICGGNFTDQGGITANYPNNSNFTTTICPNNIGEAVTVTFTSFNTEVNQDALYVYNGVNITPSALIASSNGAGNVPGGLAGGYWGNTIPGPFTSTSPNGCLTFVFRSDTNNTLEGWVSNVSCDPIVCETPTSLTVSNITSTSAVLSWSTASSSNGWEVLILPQGSPPPTPDSFGSYAQTIPYVISGLSVDGCYNAYVRSLCGGVSEWSNPVNFCMFNCENNGDCAESLVLTAFLDNNNNGVKDIGETDFNYGNFVYQVNDAPFNLYGNSNSGSYYIFDSNPNNSYDINFVVNSELTSYYTSSVSHNNVTLPTGSGANTLYFPIVNTQPHVNATVSLNPSGQPRPGFTYVVSILYQNFGSQTIPNGTLTFTKDPNVTITDISQSGIVATTNGFTYDFTGLAPLESRFIYLTLLVPPIPTVNLGDLITNNVTIQISNDIDLSNNMATLTQAIVGSYDPNDKMESHGGKILHADFTANDYLYYTIQFENTGTASAEFIRVEDVLDAKLDQNTFEMISASHNVNTRRNDNQLIWHFYNINLPPTVTNPTGSHGYVYFKIKPKAGYAVGDIIPNTASIYFDYNPAIITNTFNTQFVQALSNTTFDNNGISLYPNPTRTNFIVNNSGQIKISEISIYDVSGKKIYSLTNTTEQNINIDVSSFAKGLYLVEISSEDYQKLTKKLIIQY